MNHAADNARHQPQPKPKAKAKPKPKPHPRRVPYPKTLRCLQTLGATKWQMHQRDMQGNARFPIHGIERQSCHGPLGTNWRSKGPFGPSTTTPGKLTWPESKPSSEKETYRPQPPIFGSKICWCCRGVMILRPWNAWRSSSNGRNWRPRIPAGK